MIRQLFCNHRWKLRYTTRAYSSQLGITYECTKCGKTLFINCNYPVNDSPHIWTFDGYEGMDTSMFHCKHCGKKIKIDVKG